MFSILKEDLRVNDDLISKAVCITFRFGRWSRSLKIPILKHVLIFIYRIFYVFVKIISQSEIPAACQIGKGLKLEHGGKGVVIHPQAKIGENARIFHQVTIGQSKGEIPQIGDNVYFGSGAKIIGGISIGNNVKIGANAVVLKDIPENCTAVGVPAKIVKSLVS